MNLMKGRCLMKSKKTITYDDLKLEIEKYLTLEEVDDVKKAYDYAYLMHKGQYRKTGEEYIIHPLYVAFILTSINADKDTIIAALLHDVIEDTDTTKEEVSDMFGPSVANLVDGVTKINSINVSTENEYLTGYYKKIIVGMSEDVRVIIIKLADRLHNMRTLKHLTRDRQIAISKETMDLYAPLANRLRNVLIKMGIRRFIF